MQQSNQVQQNNKWKKKKKINTNSAIIVISKPMNNRKKADACDHWAMFIYVQLCYVRYNFIHVIFCQINIYLNFAAGNIFFFFVFSTLIKSHAYFSLYIAIQLSLFSLFVKFVNYTNILYIIIFISIPDPALSRHHLLGCQLTTPVFTFGRQPICENGTHV